MKLVFGRGIGNTAPQSVIFYETVLRVVPNTLLMPIIDLS